jgi:hypothetical protein
MNYEFKVQDLKTRGGSNFVVTLCAMRPAFLKKRGGGKT